MSAGRPAQRPKLIGRHKNRPGAEPACGQHWSGYDGIRRHRPVCGPSGGAANFNGDGYDDLAIGARGDGDGGGAVTIMMGGANRDNQRWTLDTAA